MENNLLSCLSVLASLFLGYLVGYMRKKGENRAIHEDLDKLVIQVKTTTEATKRIEAQISHEVWNRQRQWELKREMLLEGARSISDFLAAVQKLNAAFSIDEESENPAFTAQLANHQSEVMIAYNKASYDFQRAQLLVSVVSSLETQRVFVAMEKVLKTISSKIVDGNTEVFRELLPLVKTNASAITNAIRKELQLEVNALESAPQSNESSPRQTKL